MKVRINSESKILRPAKDGDAGFDIFAAAPPILCALKKNPKQVGFDAISFIEYDTGLILAPEEGYHVHIFPRSSISNMNLSLANSVATIDNGYRGTIKLRFRYLVQPEDLMFDTVSGQITTKINNNKIYKLNDKIGQIVFTKTLIPELESVLFFEETERASGGFGSTGK